MFKLLFTGGPDNHRIFEYDGRLFIADRSGRSPRFTDDPPLEIEHQPVVLRNGTTGLLAGLKVKPCLTEPPFAQRNVPSGSSVHVTPVVADWLAARWGVPLRVELDGGAVVGVLTVTRR